MAGEKIKIQLLAEVGTLSELTALCAPIVLKAHLHWCKLKLT